MGVIMEFTSFDEMPDVSHLQAVDSAQGVAGQWSGTATSLQTGWNGSGLCVRGPSNLLWSGVPSYPSVGVKCKIRVRTLGVAQTLVELNGSQINGAVRLNSSNQLIATNVDAAGTTYTSSTVVAQDVWYDLEFWQYIHDSDGRWRVIFDNSVIAALSGVGADTHVSGVLFIGGPLFNNADIDIDDVVVIGVDGRFETADVLSRSGVSVRMKSLHPTANGTYDAWLDGTGTGARWERVDEAVANNDTDTIISTGTNLQSFVMEQVDVVTDEITKLLSVRTQVEFWDPFAALSKLKVFIRADGTEYYDSETWLAFPYSYVLRIWPQELASSQDWADMEPDEAITALNLYEVGLFNPATGGFATHVSQVVMTVLWLTGSTRATGIVLRGAYDFSGALTKGYVCRLEYGPFGDIDAIVARMVTSGPLVDVATATVTTGYGLAFDQNYELRASIENVGGASPASGTPSITVEIDSARVSNWTALIAGIDVGDDDEVLDETAEAILSGSSQGLYLIPPPSGEGFLYYSLWSDDFEPPPDEQPPEDEPSLPVGVECSGKTGTFAAPVGSSFSVDVGASVIEHPYESGHVARILKDEAQRKRWRISLPEGITTTEKTDLWDFWNDHGKSIPFDFADPETGEMVCAHFLDDGLSTIKAAPSANGYECIIEELLEMTGPLIITVPPVRPQTGTSLVPSLRITPYAPMLSLVAPATRAVAITRFAPIPTIKIIPGTKSLTITRFAPTIIT